MSKTEAISICPASTTFTTSSNSPLEMPGLMRRKPAETAELIDITMEAAINHLFLLSFALMVNTPEKKKRVKVQMPNEKMLSFPWGPIIQIARAMIPQMIWMTPSTVAALI